MEVFMDYTLFVGNIPYATTEEELKAFFEQAGAVSEAKIIRDRDTGRSKGFGFVTYSDEAALNEAIKSLNNADFNGRKLHVDRARARNADLSQ